MKLLLTSNGFTAIIEKAFLGLLQKPAQMNSVGFITTAAYGEEEGPAWNCSLWLEEYRNQLRQQKITKIEDIDLKNKTEEELEKILLQKDIIFVNGGNTFYLMYWAKKSGFDKVVCKFLQKGGVYVGVSAGSIIACPTIETAGWKPADINNVRLTDLTALGLVPFLIHPHFEEVQKEDIANEAKYINYPVVSLTNEQAVLVNNGQIQVIGEGEILKLSNLGRI